MTSTTTDRATAASSVDVEVVTVRWPADADLLTALRRSGRARLLLVDERAPAPVIEDCLEDWVRLPADQGDVEARVAGLRRSIERHGESEGPVEAGAAVEPVLDADGLLWVGDRWASIPPVEARLVGALLTKMSAVVSRDALGRAAWPDGAPGRNALDVHVLRLRRRLAPLGLAIRTIRSRGYLLEIDHEGPAAANGQVRNGSENRA